MKRLIIKWFILYLVKRGFTIRYKLMSIEKNGSFIITSYWDSAHTPRKRYIFNSPEINQAYNKFYDQN